MAAAAIYVRVSVGASAAMAAARYHTDSFFGTPAALALHLSSSMDEAGVRLSPC
jgi:hypothetical protein